MCSVITYLEDGAMGFFCLQSDPISFVCPRQTTEKKKKKKKKNRCERRSEGVLCRYKTLVSIQFIASREKKNLDTDLLVGPVKPHYWKKMLLFFIKGRRFWLEETRKRNRSRTERAKEREKNLRLILIIFLLWNLFSWWWRMTKYIETNFKRCQGCISLFQRSRKKEKNQRTQGYCQTSTDLIEWRQCIDRSAIFFWPMFIPETFSFWLVDVRGIHPRARSATLRHSEMMLRVEFQSRGERQNAGVIAE